PGRGRDALGAGLAIGLPMLAAENRSMDMSPQIVAAVLFAVVAYSLIGVCCGVIFRSQSAAVLVIVGAFFVEKILGMFIGDGAAAAAALAVTTLALVAFAARLFSRRDVTS
ncbi:MAG: hypothetical protein ABWY50_08125, partial [Aeromicrobium sp.]